MQGRGGFLEEVHLSQSLEEKLDFRKQRRKAGVLIEGAGGPRQGTWVQEAGTSSCTGTQLSALRGHGLSPRGNVSAEPAVGGAP